MTGEDLRLNQMGVAVWLLDRTQLTPMNLREEPDLNRITKGKQYVLREQAKVFLKGIPDMLMRKHFCTVGSGQGIVVRLGRTYYDFSPYFQRALERTMM